MKFQIDKRRYKQKDRQTKIKETDRKKERLMIKKKQTERQRYINKFNFINKVLNWLRAWD